MMPFRVRTIGSLEPPEAAFVRFDIVGSMLTLAYDGGRVRLTQWRADDIDTRTAVVPVGGSADEVDLGRTSALWIEGAACGIFTVVGADRGIHHELFELAPGALLWHANGIAFLLQGATRADAMQLAVHIDS